MMLRRLLGSLQPLGVLFSIATGQSPVTILPPEPILGDEVTIIYDPNALGSKFKGVDQIAITLLAYQRPSVRKAISFGDVYDMEYSGGIWKKGFIFTDSVKPLYKFQFSSGVGDSSVFHSDDSFYFMLHNEDGVPLPSAHLLRYFMMGSLHPPVDDSLRREELNEECRLYPLNYRAIYIEWANRLKDTVDRPKNRAEVRHIVDSVFTKHSDLLDALVGCANAYRDMGDTVKANELELRITSSFPNSKDAEILQFSKAFRNTDVAQEIQSLSDLLLQFPNSEMADRAYGRIEEYYAQRNDTVSPNRLHEVWINGRRSDINRVVPGVKDIRRDILTGEKPYAPYFIVRDIYGADITFDQVKGRVVVLDFWASWCAPCLKAFPDFESLFERFHEQESVVFMAINVDTPDERPENINTFLQGKGYSFPVAFDPGLTMKQFSITQLPTTIIINPEGKIVFRTHGYLNSHEYVTSLSTAINTVIGR